MTERKMIQTKQNKVIRMDFWTVLWHGLPVVALFIWGAFCITNNLWYDEAYSASMVSLSWKRLIYITATDDHSPFYYVLLKLFYHLCGGGTHFWALKLMSVLFMLGYMLLGKYYVEKLFDRKISVYFMLFSLLMPIFSVQAGNVRMYAVALFFLTLTGLSAYDIFREATHRKWIVFCIASICTVYCHTFALIQTFFILYAFSGGDSDLPEEGTGERIFHLRIYGCDRVLPLACSDMQTIYPADAL